MIFVVLCPTSLVQFFLVNILLDWDYMRQFRTLIKNGKSLGDKRNGFTLLAQ